jgi:hypothetical protein
VLDVSGSELNVREVTLRRHHGGAPASAAFQCSIEIARAESDSRIR